MAIKITAKTEKDREYQKRLVEIKKDAEWYLSTHWYWNKDFKEKVSEFVMQYFENKKKEAC